MKAKVILAIWAIIFIILPSCEPDEPEPPFVPPDSPYVSPEVKTLAASEITTHSAIIGGEITKLGNEPITKKGICWLPSANTPEALERTNPAIVNNVIEITEPDSKFSFLMDKLEPNQTYVYRAFVQNAIGVVYGQKLHFTTEHETITDIDGNVYRILKIGKQTWTIDNYNATRLRDGTPIPNRIEDSYWARSAPQEPAMCWYDNDRSKYEKDYGALYNWYAASHPLLAPEGWRVPTNSECDSLAFYLMRAFPDHPGTLWSVGGLCKTRGYDYWQPPNTDATNESGFSAKAGGIRFGGDEYFAPGFYAFGYHTVFYCSSEYGGYAETFRFAYDKNYFISDLLESKTYAYSLRLIKDE